MKSEKCLNCDSFDLYDFNDASEKWKIQRPFVWDSSKVRDLTDSLYQSYPGGYVSLGEIQIFG